MKKPVFGSLEQNIQYAFVSRLFSITLFFLPRLIEAAENGTTFHAFTHHGNLRPSSSSEMVDPSWLVTGERALQEECTAECCSQYAVTCEESKGNPLSSTPLAVQIILIVFLICMSAFFSGLTLGIMGLDKTGLEIVMEGDDEKYAALAKRIYPVRKRGNLLLCTLLLGNVCVNSFLSILTADKFGGIIGLVSSTFLIVIFGEIVPQAACQRYSLEVGSAAVPMVKVIIILLFPVAFPLSLGLDWALGEELATTYSSGEMKKLLQIHVQQGEIDPDTAIAMQGALQYKTIPVKNVMTPLENTFMLSADERLNFETIARIFKTGYSRIPVYSVSKNNVIGLLFVKDLIFIDPEDNTRLSDFVNIFGRGLHVVWPDDSLGDVLRELKSGKSHMALVRDVNNEDESQDPFYEVKGIITLEDIIEEIIGGEIIDETDAFVDGTHRVAVNREDEGTMWAGLRLLDSKIVDERLSYDNVNAVTAHLSRNFPSIFSLISETQLHRLISETPVSVLPTAPEYDISQEFPDDLMYQRDQESSHCTLVLSGKVTVVVGQDDFRSDVSSMSLLAGGALITSPYVPDFTAWVSAGPCRCIQISRDRFAAAMDASLMAQKVHGTGGSSPSLSNKKNVVPPIPKTSDTQEPTTEGVPQAHPPSEEESMTEPKKPRNVKFLTALKAVEAPDDRVGKGKRRTFMAAAATTSGQISGPQSLSTGDSKAPSLLSLPEEKQDEDTTNFGVKDRIKDEP